MQLVRLLRDGEVARMSKRKGRQSPGRLGGGSGQGCCAFFFNMRSADSHLDFDLDLAVKQSMRIRYSMCNMPMPVSAVSFARWRQRALPGMSSGLHDLNC